MTAAGRESAVAEVIAAHHLTTKPGRGCVWIMGCRCGFDTPLVERWAEHVATVLAALDQPAPGADERAADLANVEAAHPKFGAFLRRALRDPEVAEAYYAAQSRRDGDPNEPDSPAEPGRLVESREADTDAGMEGADGGASAASGLEVAPEPTGEVGRARIGLTAAERDAIADACDAAYDFGNAWVRMLRSGAENMLLPVVEAILTARAHQPTPPAQAEAVGLRWDDLSHETKARMGKDVASAYASGLADGKRNAQAEVVAAVERAAIRALIATGRHTAETARAALAPADTGEGE